MKNENESKNLSVIRDLLYNNDLLPSFAEDLHIESLAGDGSSRKFWRISAKGKRICLAVAPPVRDKVNLAEANAARAIGLHLLQKNIRVPRQFAWDQQMGILLFEDFGDCKLHGYVRQSEAEAGSPRRIKHKYIKVVENLADMQIKGAEAFDTDWCWDTPNYDKDLMLERESGYFLQAFWQGLLGHKTPTGLPEEFENLADLASAIPAVFFLHRDFQSRNIMLDDGDICFIDFQGGRLGPLAYDLASLLIDPYVCLPLELQEELLEHYIHILESITQIDRKIFSNEYLLLALHRNLQIVGAFSFLSEERAKIFFSQYIKPALSSLQNIVENSFFENYPILRKCVQESRQEFIK